MKECAFCRYEVMPDDEAIATASATRTICIRCFKRAAEDEHPMPPALRREVIAALGRPLPGDAAL